jgi:glycosyltransferase involved in cell wall biosynthesis
MFEMASIIRREAPDVVHCTHFPTPSRAMSPLVVTLHDLTPLIIPAVMPSTAKRFVYRMLNARAVGLAARIIAPSHATANDLARIFPASANKTVVVSEAADDFASGEVAPDPEVQAPYILAMGNTKAHKDLPTLLSAFGRVAPRVPDLRLVLAGEEPAGYLASMVPDGSRHLVSFTGPLTDARLRALYEYAAVFAFPSRYEGFGLPLLEAMSFGTPVVAASSSSIPEVVGDAALLVPPGDETALAATLEVLLTDVDLWNELSDKGRARAAEFSWRETARLTADVYRDALTAR